MAPDKLGLLLAFCLSMLVRAQYVCPSGKSPASMSSVQSCVEYTSNSCCSSSQDAALTSWLRAAVNKTAAPDCYEALRVISCA